VNAHAHNADSRHATAAHATGFFLAPTCSPLLVPALRCQRILSTILARTLVSAVPTRGARNIAQGRSGSVLLPIGCPLRTRRLLFEGYGIARIQQQTHTDHAVAPPRVMGDRASRDDEAPGVSCAVATSALCIGTVHLVAGGLGRNTASYELVAPAAPSSSGPRKRGGFERERATRRGHNERGARADSLCGAER
jgi:hypothetical protein